LQASSWPTGQIGKDALLGMARSKLAAYKGPKYDASELIGATLSEAGPYDSARRCYEEFKAQYHIDADAIPIAQILKGRCYEEFKSQYPQDANEAGVDRILKEIEQEEARKQLHIARYYQRTYRPSKDGDEINPANLYFQMIVERWPGSKAAETARKMLIKNLGGKKTKEEK
jgi:outer membrane protein assembly factor BamD (BamD/ComL family)